MTGISWEYCLFVHVLGVILMMFMREFSQNLQGKITHNTWQDSSVKAPHFLVILLSILGGQVVLSTSSKYF